jgi:hypothetical protein
MHTMHVLHSVAIRPNLELKTQPKQLLGSLPLVLAIPGISYGAMGLSRVTLSRVTLSRMTLSHVTFSRLLFSQLSSFPHYMK